MLDFLELIAAVGEVLFSWRFLLCVVVSLAVVAAVYWLVPDHAVCLSISVPLAAVGLIGGFIWQWRKD
jgi:hypothetical protein